MNSIIQYLTTTLPTYIPFFIIIVAVASILYKAHTDTNEKFTVFDLIEDPTTGKGSLEKVGMLFAQLSLSWWFISTAASGKVTTEDILSYGAVMGVSKIANAFIQAKYNKPQ